jgi:RNA polymerase sigma factor (sigma-70 family)
VPLRPRLPLRTLPLRRVVRLRDEAQGRTVDAMEARALVDALKAERARFVRLVRPRVANEADADDIVQRALIRASERAGTVADPARARAWFYRILRHALVDHHRERRSDPLRHRIDADLTELAGDDPAQDRSPCACGVRLLGGIRPAYAEVIRRVDVDGEDPVVVARALGISTGNLHVRLHRARRLLREKVGSHCGVVSVGPCLDCTCDGRRRCGD